MTDVLTPEQRRLNMSRIRGKDTKPEMLLRRGLHARGFRFRLHRRDLPGCPDLVFSHCHAVIFVNGCFWHGRECPMFKLPATRAEFWRTKVLRNVERDRIAQEKLMRDKWRVFGKPAKSQKE
jgi:DNA mismatch endonuclease (patch repair protein)